MDIDVGSSLLLLGEFQRVAEDLDSLLLMTGSTCLGKLTVEAEHLPAPERTQQTTVHKVAGSEQRPPLCLDPPITEASHLIVRHEGDGEETRGKYGKGVVQLEITFRVI